MTYEHSRILEGNMVNEDERTEEQPDDEPEPETGNDEDVRAELDKWKKLARQNERQAKANADAARRLAEIEDSQKSEVEKLQEAQRTAEQRAAEAEQRAMRLEVAAAKGLTPAQAKRLVGETMDDLEADAEELLASFKPPEDEDDRNDLNRRPRERLRTGATGNQEPEPDASKLADSILSSTF